jgi:hypothetical protein
VAQGVGPKFKSQYHTHTQKGQAGHDDIHCNSSYSEAQVGGLKSEAQAKM